MRCDASFHMAVIAPDMPQTGAALVVESEIDTTEAVVETDPHVAVTVPEAPDFQHNQFSGFVSGVRAVSVVPIVAVVG